MATTQYAGRERIERHYDHHQRSLQTGRARADRDVDDRDVPRAVQQADKYRGKA